MKAATAVITTSQQTLDDLKKYHPEIPAQKFFCILNGYDGTLAAWQAIDPSKETFIIGYVGNFYYTPHSRKQMFTPWWEKRGHRMLQYIPHKQDWLYRSPYFFFKALQELKKQHPLTGKNLQVKFAGKKPSWLIDMIADLGLGEQVELIGDRKSVV